ncbi:hypothetical protein J2772_002998 [Chryseobacterium jejuense]|nr:hypothetical protein [Chryseobacterium jejuense]
MVLSCLTCNIVAIKFTNKGIGNKLKICSNSTTFITFLTTIINKNHENHDQHFVFSVISPSDQRNFALRHKTIIFKTLEIFRNSK